MQQIDLIKQNIIKLCSIPSIQAPALEGMPFGKAISDALIFTLDLAKDMGFETVNYDGYVGEVIWKGEEGEQTMGILCHLDVVKEGRLADWKYPPFTPTEEDGKIYARGTLDDKGPTICVLHMLKELKDEGFKPKKTIKLILGCNEESGWECMKHYKKVAKMPDFGFSPDGAFPVLYAEKGIFHPVRILVTPLGHLHIHILSLGLSHQSFPFLQRDLQNSLFPDDIQYFSPFNEESGTYAVRAFDHEVHRSDVARHGHFHIVRKDRRLLLRCSRRSLSAGT